MDDWRATSMFEACEEFKIASGRCHDGDSDAAAAADNTVPVARPAHHRRCVTAVRWLALVGTTRTGDARSPASWLTLWLQNVA